MGTTIAELLEQLNRPLSKKLDGSRQSHPRSRERGRSTRDTHRPQRHVAIIENSLAVLLKRAGAIGPATLEVLRQQAARRSTPGRHCAGDSASGP
jgi:hypothetical protein